MLVNILVFHVCQMILAMGLTTAQICYETGNFTTDSTYGRNRDLLLASLSINVSKNGGFFSGSIGQDPNKVYALGLCRGDASDQVCSDRIESATRGILAECHSQKEAISWGPGNPPCIVRYTNRSIVGTLELDPTNIGCNDNNIDSNLTHFDEVWGNLTDSLERKASMGSFATEETDFTNLRRIYSLMQCTPALSQRDCSNCLRVCVDDYRRRCHGRQGGFVHKPNCFFRWDLYPFYESSAEAPVRSLPPPPRSTDTIAKKDKGSATSRTAIFIVVSIATLTAFVTLTCIMLLKIRKKTRSGTKNEHVSNRMPFDFSRQSLQLDFSTIKEATMDFSNNNKLGQGGFGTVYKGTLPDGQEVAVKRLSRNSEQGESEFKNEVILMARLQHRNLVRLIDPTKRLLLNWELRYTIIGGIARGIHYLHEDSRLRIIHRDLKADNILLDAEMNPKISDFGMAKLFNLDQTHTDTSRIVGTFGYMAPEYVKQGHFSVKSDVYSFGVLVLEIITGEKISHFFHEETGSLPTYVWENWKKGSSLNVIDSNLKGGSRREMLKCIHLGLLCVQEDIGSRPSMGSVVVTLSRCTYSLPEPTKPGFCLNSSPVSGNTDSDDSKTRTIQFTRNEVSNSDMVPR
ncbi:pyruvate decarboxylase 1-like [Hibiscus syriacus]|uniref:Pyruvate decarboxylase 1-like n=1 Tax=Hibiscus syriacus TaxID=106335 RepID=A0A6A3BE57_HIBSY|nr:pyruvate decarboxylase 1-like [Hibiscus syriacus]